MQLWEEKVMERMEGKAEGKAEGIAEGIRALIEACKDFDIPKNEAILKVMQKFSLSRENAEIYFGKYWD